MSQQGEGARHLKVAFDPVPGPAPRTFCAKTMRRLPFPGPGGPLELRNVDCGMRIEKENPKIRNPQFEIRNSIGRCFLHRSSLPPGHHSSIPEMSNFNSPRTEPGVYIKSLSVNSIPPFVKGGQGGFPRGISKQIPLFPPFSKGDLNPTTYLRISSKEIKPPSMPVSLFLR